MVVGHFLIHVLRKWPKFQKIKLLATNTKEIWEVNAHNRVVKKIANFLINQNVSHFLKTPFKN